MPITASPTAARMNRCRRDTPATSTTPSQIAMKTMLVPRSGWMNTSPTHGATIANDISNVRRSFASPPCSLKKFASSKIVASFANSEG